MNSVLLQTDSGCSSLSCYFFAYIGVASAIVFSNMGAAYGTAKSGVGISSMGVVHPQLIMRNMIPVVMAGVLGIYGLIISVILSGNIDSGSTYNEYQASLNRFERYDAQWRVHEFSTLSSNAGDCALMVDARGPL